ncbi:MAG: hypothetical protein NTW52_02485 [Planctomycetota bacterium]|nr:hypothetical protein [Planctomycetota bacterium]
MTSSTGASFQQRLPFAPHLTQLSQWIGSRKVILENSPAQVQQKRWLAIVASHRQSNRETSSAWREAIESAMRRCGAEELTLLLCRETPLGDYLLHAAKRFELSILELLIPPPHESYSNWESKNRSLHKLANGPPDSQAILRISPLIEEPLRAGGNRNIVSLDNTDVQGPLADVAMIALADFVHAIDVRKNGRVDRILRHRLTASIHQLGSVAVDLTPPAEDAPRSNTMMELMDLGAIGWYRPSKYDLPSPMVSADEPIISAQESLIPNRDDRQYNSPSRVGSRANQAFSPVFSNRLVTSKTIGPVDSQWSYLTHCTRSPNGPWPDQSLAGYYNEMLTEVDHSHPLDALIRILEQQRLIATSYLKRTDVATVSMSEVPLQELLSRRNFQRHLHRWDWEPYGICVRRSWLTQRGCRPVAYGTKFDFQKLPREDQPFFHVIPDGTAWKEEREWRIAEDLRLADIPAKDAFVFVPSVSEGRRVSSISRFPVMIVESCIELKRPS